MTSFEAQVGEWVKSVENATETIFKEALQELVSELNALVPVATGFLRSSLIASKSALPQLVRENPGIADSDFMGAIELVIMGADVGETVYLGYSANYGGHVHFGTNGRPGRPWVALVAQRWPEIVNRISARVRAALGL